MAKNKTTETDNPVAGYISQIDDEKRRTDFSTLIDQFAQASGLPPKMWGHAIVGFGSYHYKYDSGHEGDAPLAGLSSRANAIVLYLAQFDQREQLLQEFGKFKTGKSCIYVKKIEDIDLKVLQKMVRRSVEHTRKQYPS